MGIRMVREALSIVIMLLLVLSVALPMTISAADDKDYGKSPVKELEENEEQAEEVYHVTLVTGDTVTVVINEDSQRSFAISLAEPGKLGQHFLTVEQNGDTYIIPDGIDWDKLDQELFNVDYLIDEEYHKEASLPLILSYAPGTSKSAAKSLEENIRAIGQDTKSYEELPLISTRLSYKNVSSSYLKLISQPQIEKAWLDKKVHTQLIDSVPLIDAPTWWEAGFTGEGMEIAVLDTGIDFSHPALDDLDDNPATNDPKVVVNANFTDDTSFDDLFGHGTHVAGIAAGTSGESLQAHSGSNAWFSGAANDLFSTLEHAFDLSTDEGEWSLFKTASTGAASDYFMDSAISGFGAFAMATDGTLYLYENTVYADLFKSDDGGRTWEQTDYVADVAGGAIVDIACSSQNPNIIYVATADAVYKTTNAGDSWNEVGASTIGAIGTESITSIDVCYYDIRPYIFIGTSTGYYSGDVYYKEDFTFSGGWTALSIDDGATNITLDVLAVNCSPNFDNDVTVFAVVTDATPKPLIKAREKQ